MTDLPAKHGHQHAHNGPDPIPGKWIVVINEGDTPPGDPFQEDVDYIFLQNSVVQPTPPLMQFAFRRGGIHPLDFKGGLDVSGASSPAIAAVIPDIFLAQLEGEDPFDITTVYDGTDAIAGMWYLDASTGELTLTWPLV